MDGYGGVLGSGLREGGGGLWEWERERREGRRGRVVKEDVGEVSLFI